jgi:hypothetical protein
MQRLVKKAALVARDRVSPPPTAPPEAAPVAEAPVEAPGAPSYEVLSYYTSAAPSAQQAVDTFAGEWYSRLPDELGVSAGPSPLFDDARMKWLIDAVGGMEGLRVLELGPLEGGHTWMMHNAGATIDAIEANSRAFLKCLVVKELLGLERVRFLRGDCIAFLESGPEPYDLVVASGVLYHMRDPLRLLDLLAGAGDRLMLWTHYYEGDHIPEEQRRQFTAAPIEVTAATGRRCVLHPRHYVEALDSPSFCGGPAETANWMEREDILGHLGDLGFDQIEVEFDEYHGNGPCFCVLAQRTAGIGPSAEPASTQRTEERELSAEDGAGQRTVDA